MSRFAIDVAVVVPLHNKQASVVRAVQSALSQTHRPSTVVVVDDGSTDKSVERIAEAGLLPRIQLIQQEQRGPGPARNAGWSACDAEWIAFLDADDVWKPNHLASLQSAIHAYPHVEWATTTREFEWGSNRRGLEVLHGSLRRAWRASERPQAVLANYFLLAVHGEALPNSSSTMIRRSALEAVGGFPDALPSEDLALWCVLALRGDMACSRARTLIIRKDGANITKRLRGRARVSDRFDPMALRNRPDVAVIDSLRDASVLDEDVRFWAECYMDFLLTRHWVTIILDASQPLARKSLGLVRRRKGTQFHLFLLASWLPSWVARPVGRALSMLLDVAGFEKPVSPFADRGWQGRQFQNWLDNVVESFQ